MNRTSAPGVPLRVVVVDDTPDLRDLLRMAMERTGEFSVVAEAGNGREAVELSREHHPDIVLLDIAMPVMDGLEALPLVRQASPSSTVVMLSGFGASEMTAKALAGGADGYIQKGQPLGTTLAQVRTLAARRADRERGEDDPPAREPERSGAADHLEHAPFGFLVVRRGRVVDANREASRLLGALVGDDVRLEAVAPELDEHLRADPPPDTGMMLDLGDPPRRVLATVRRTGEDQVVYLQTLAGDEADLLRRAIATAAHEIRNPVGVLMGIAETLALHGAELTPADEERMFAAIGRQTRLLDGITADLLAAGQAQHGTLAVQLEPVDAVELVQGVLDDDIVLVPAAPSGVRMLADPIRCQQMLTNLVSNARKYGAPPLTIRVVPEGDHVRVEVEDCGDGVPEEFRPRLFQEYSRAPGTTARGTGLGLFVVRALAEAQGGSVTYRPRTPTGSVFTVRFPAASG